MKKIIIFILLIICGCSPLPKDIIGKYISQKGDVIIIKKGGEIIWSPGEKATLKKFFVGMAAKSDKPNNIRVIVPSSSPFLGCNIQYSSNHTHLTVNWGGHKNMNPGKNRSTEYEKL